MSRKTKAKATNIMSSKAQADEALAKQSDPLERFTAAISDKERIAALTAKDVPRVLIGCVCVSQRLYWILRRVAELPAFLMPQKEIDGIKPSKSSVAEWKASHPAWDHTLNETYLLNKVEDWTNALLAAWHAVDLAAEDVDKGDTGASRWSIRTKTAISRLSTRLGISSNSGEDLFAELVRRLACIPN